MQGCTAELTLRSRRIVSATLCVVISAIRFVRLVVGDTLVVVHMGHLCDLAALHRPPRRNHVRSVQHRLHHQARLHSWAGALLGVGL